MDPNTTLEDLRLLASRWDEWGHIGLDPMSSMDQFAELFFALDDWLTSGGFRPDDWS
jgi:hypothetical protein